MSSSEKPLKIINASAGSGKTYHLVKEYLKLILNSRNSGTSFKGILAMTFTNKAALEMKDRILEALDDIGHPIDGKSKKEDLIQQLVNETNLNSEEIILNCKETLREILHQFEEFGVMTIDKFNLRLIKAFSRDIDLPGDFEIVFNDDEVLNLVLDELLSKLGNKDFPEINDLVVKYARSRIEDGEKWNVKTDLIEFSKVLNDERNKNGVSTLLNTSFNSAHREEIITRKHKIDRDLAVLTDQLKTEIEHIDPEILPGGKSTLNSLNKLVSLQELPLDQIVTPTIEKNLDKPGKKVFPQEMASLLREIIQYWNSHREEYAAILDHNKNFFNMALLKFIAQELGSIRKNERVIRISEFNELIGKLIQDEDAPFIYERLGNKYAHFLLDEFQDTSFMQWRNLIPLVHHSISTENLNLIVGDAKQSIYRFKNGLAEQFIALPGIYNPENDPKVKQLSDYFKLMGNKTELKDNWRSSAKIVSFNNDFFSVLRNHLSEKGRSFYNSIEQHPQSNLNGSVDIYSSMESMDEDQLLDVIIEKINHAIVDGFQPSDLCILGPTNKLCNAWALNLTKRGFKVVSSESLLVDSDISVQLVMSYLKFRINPEGKTEQRYFASKYFEKFPHLHSAYSDYLSSDPEKSTEFNFESFVEDHFEKVKLFQHFETLYDLNHRFMKLIGLDELKNAYLHHLSDVIFEFEQVHGPDLTAFLEFYESKKKDLAVQVPESDDALTVMTIHKSKGLEFPVVIIPTLDFRTESKKKFIYDHDDLLIYKKPGKNEVLKKASEIFTEEEDQTFLDNVNALYVAMTRPQERLVILNYNCDKNSFSLFFDTILRELGGCSVNKNSSQFVSGFQARNNNGKKEKTNPYIPHSVNDLLFFPEIALQDKEELIDTGYLETERQYGVQFHELVASVKSPLSIEEMETIIDRKIKSGKIQTSFLNQLRQDVINVLTNENYKKLIEGGEEIKECTLLSETGEELRPDSIIKKHDETIVIDFKTGKHNQKKDLKQVSTYCSMLHEMNFPNVKGYLYYSDDLELLSV